MPTTGGFTRMPAHAQAEILDGMGAAVDAAGGAFTMCYATIAATAARRSWGIPNECGLRHRPRAAAPGRPSPC